MKKKHGDAIKRMKPPLFLSKVKTKVNFKVIVKKVNKRTKKLPATSTKAFDTAKSRCVKFEKLLEYDHLRECSLFEGDSILKYNKAHILYELKKSLQNED